MSNPQIKANTKRELVEAFEAAEAALDVWAGVLADEDDDTATAEALRLKNAIIRYRCEITP